MLRLLAAAALAAFFAAPAAASFVTVEPVSRGCLAPSGASACGDSFTADGNFFTGEPVPFDPLTRGFLIFDLSGLSGTLLSAVLEIDFFRVATSEASEFVTAIQISDANVATLLGASGSASIYNDLGAGINLGYPAATPAENGSTKSFALTAPWLSAVSGAFGGDFGVGFALASFSGGGAPSGEGLFAASSRDPVRLTLEFGEADAAVPGPLPAVLLLTGLGALGVAARRKAG